MRYKKSKGFTLIELVVAIAIFIVIISIILSLFVTGLKGHRKVMAIQNVQENGLFLLEFIAKEIRMSEIRDVTPNGNSASLYIKRADGENITYSFSGGTVDRTSPSTSGPLNSGEVSVSGSFYIMGIGDDNQQPRVTIVMKVETVGKAEEKSEISIQTTLSPRNLES